jgi:hypothetical protein
MYDLKSLVKVGASDRFNKQNTGPTSTYISTRSDVHIRFSENPTSVSEAVVYFLSGPSIPREPTPPVYRFPCLLTKSQKKVTFYAVKQGPRGP